MREIVSGIILIGALAATALDGHAPAEGIDAAAPDIQLSLNPDFAADLRIAQAPDAATAEEKKPDIFYVPTPQRLVDVMLLMAEVKKDDLLYDLGSGDGRLVITAARRYGARGIGIEIDPRLIAEAKRNARAAKVEDKVDFRQQDLFTSDFEDANVITLYLLDELNERLRPQIFAQVKPGTRIVSHAFRMGDWEPDAERLLKVRGISYSAFFWVVPANMSGRWRLSADRDAKGLPDTVVIEQSFQRLTVQRADNRAVIGEGSLSGSDFVLTIDAARGKRVSFTGRIDGSTIKAGAAGARGTWRAEREPGSEKPIDPAQTLQAPAL